MNPGMHDSYLISEAPAEIPLGWHFCYCFGFAGLGLQPGFKDGPPKVQFMLGFRTLFGEHWERYNATMGLLSKLRAHTAGAGWLGAGAFDPRSVVGKTALMLYGMVQNSEQQARLGISAMAPATKPPAGSGITKESLGYGDNIIVERDTPIPPDVLARLPGWLSALLLPPPPTPVAAYQMPRAPAAPAYRPPVAPPPAPVAPVAPAAPPPAPVAPAAPPAPVADDGEEW